MTEMDWVNGAHGDTGVTQMDGATGSRYSADPGGHRHSSLLIIRQSTHSTLSIF
jgi:hypothetical protein